MSLRKVVIFVGSLTSGGAERVAVNLTKHLDSKSEFSVTLVTLNSIRYDFYEIDDRINRIALDLEGQTSGVAKFTDNFHRILSFRRVVKRLKPDVVIGLITRQAIISLIACLFLDVKVIVSERNYPPKRKNHSLWEYLRMMTYRNADAHVVQTKKIAKWIRKKAGGKNVYIIPNSITLPMPINQPILLPESILDKNAKIILAVGSLKVQKGFDLLVEAISNTLKKHDKWKLVIIGGEVDNGSSTNSSEVRNNLNKLIEFNDLQEKVLLPGKAGNIGDWYEKADIFVLSSRFEGFPNVLLEAMGHGLASVAFNCDTGPSDLIQHMVNGILVEAENTYLMSQEIEKLIEDSELRERLSEKALEVVDEYSDAKIFNKWEHAIKSFNNNKH